MFQLIDFSECPYSDRHGTYGGLAGDKDGILYQHQYWLIKYPKSTKFFTGQNLASYTTAPLSEYLGSHIYQILGYSVHETQLGYRNNTLVVGCKDFCKTRGSLLEIRTIKNGAYKELNQYLDTKLHHSSTGERVNLEELLLHFQYNPILKQLPNLEQRFWDCLIIDILIDNNDRNNGNWGILYNEFSKTYQIAPIYDNGNAFLNKTSDEKIKEFLQQNNKDLYLGNRTSYDYQGHILSAKKALSLSNPNLQQAIIRVVPNIANHISEIKQFIQNIPEMESGYSICSPERKEYYILGIQTRFEELLLPAYEYLQNPEQSIEHLI